jgi:nucleotide-binding universal stress UspA family protein
MLSYLVGYDGSASADRALAFATTLAASTGARVVAATVHPRPHRIYARSAQPGADNALMEELRGAAHETLDAVRERVDDVVAFGADSPAAGLHALAEQEGCALIVVGATHRGALGRLVPGSVAERLLHGAPCAVAVVPADWQPHALSNLAVGYDGRPESRAALLAAETLGRDLGATVSLVGIAAPFVVAPGGALWAVEEQSAAMQAVVDDALASLPPERRGEARVSAGPAARSLSELSGFDALVVGSRGYGPVNSVVLGSVAHHLVDHAPCPVLVVPRSAHVQAEGGAERATAAQG